MVTCLAGQIGFSNAYSDEIEDIDDDLTASSSGRYIDQLHDLLTLENLTLTADNFVKQTVKAWSDTKNYKLGAIVSHNNKTWRAIRANNNVQPVGGEDWKETTLLSAFLRNKYNSSVLKLVDALITEKKLNEQSRTLLADKPLFVGHGAIQDAIPNTGAFRGLKIAITNPDTSVLLRFIGLQMTRAQSNMKIYVYHSSRETPITVFTLNQASNVTYQWHTVVETALAYHDLSSQAAGGYFYVGYYEDDIVQPGSVIAKQIDFSGQYACGSCSDAIENSTLYNNWSGLIKVSSFYVKNENLDLVDRTLWDADDELREDQVTYGLNLQIAVKCDITDLMCRNSNIFTDVLAQQLKVDFLETLLFTVRNNNQHEKLSRLAALALGDQQNPGEYAKLEKAKRAFSIDINGISKVCAKCVSGQFKQKSVWS